MRRVVFVILGLLELAVAGLLGHLGTQIPDGAEVHQGFESAQRVTRQAGDQVRLLRRQVQDLRRPELHEMGSRLQLETRGITATLKSQQVDFETIQTMYEAFGEIARGMDGMSESLEPAAVARWPELRATLSRSAGLLRAAQRQLDQVLESQSQYESTLQQSVLLAEAFAALLPLLTDQLDARLDEQERALNELSQSLDEVGTMLPTYARTTANVLRTGRLLAWLVGLIVGLHGSYLILSVRMGRRYSI